MLSFSYLLNVPDLVRSEGIGDSPESSHTRLMEWKCSLSSGLGAKISRFFPLSACAAASIQGCVSASFAVPRSSDTFSSNLSTNLRASMESGSQHASSNSKGAATFEGGSNGDMLDKSSYPM